MASSTPSSNGERTPLLRAPSSYYTATVADSTFTRFAAEQATADEPVEEAAGPGVDTKVPAGRLEGDERVRGWVKKIIFFGLWSSNFAFAWQSSAIPTLAPRISASFSHSELAGYLGSIFPLFSTVFTPVYGVLLDTLGRKWAMSIAAFFYGFGTLLCGLSPSMQWLIAARAFAGIGGSGLLTVSSVITTDLIRLRDRGYYQGLMMVVFGLGASIGGPISGWISDTWSWHIAFFVQVPMIIISIIIILIYLPSSPPHGIHNTPPTLLHALAGFDFLGTLLLLVAIASLMLGFSNHTAKLYAWTDPEVYVLLAVAATGTIAFLAVESKARNPVIPLSLFNGIKISSLYLSNFMLSVAAQSFLYHVPVFFTVVLGTSSATAGLYLLPNSVGLAIGSLIAGQYIRRTGRYSVLSGIGLTLPILGMYFASKWNGETRSWLFWAEIFPAGLGYSIFLCCSLVALISSFDTQQMAKATSVLYTIRSLGGTVGIALSSSIQQGVLVNDLRRILSSLPDREKLIIDILHSKSNILKFPETVRAQMEGAYAHSLAAVFIAASLAACLTLLSSLPTGENDLGERKKKRRKSIGANPNTDTTNRVTNTADV